MPPDEQDTPWPDLNEIITHPSLVTCCRPTPAACAEEHELPGYTTLWRLTVLTDPVVAWTTEYYSRAVLELRSQGRDVPDEILSHMVIADAAAFQLGITQPGAQVPAASWPAATAARWARRVASPGWGLSRRHRSECG